MGNIFREKIYVRYWISIFLEIVNCDFAYIFTIDGTLRLVHRVKIWQMGNSCNSKKLGRKKIPFFSNFFENDVEFLNFFCANLRASEISMEWSKEIPEFL